MQPTHSPLTRRATNSLHATITSHTTPVTCEHYTYVHWCTAATLQSRCWQKKLPCALTFLTVTMGTCRPGATVPPTALPFATLYVARTPPQLSLSVSTPPPSLTPCGSLGHLQLRFMGAGITEKQGSSTTLSVLLQQLSAHLVQLPDQDTVSAQRSSLMRTLAHNLREWTQADDTPLLTFLVRGTRTTE